MFSFSLSEFYCVFAKKKLHQCKLTVVSMETTNASVSFVLLRTSVHTSKQGNVSVHCTTYVMIDLTHTRVRHLPTSVCASFAVKTSALIFQPLILQIAIRGMFFYFGSLGT